MSSNPPFEPTLSDVLVVRAMLAQAVILPELVGTILDHAEYWARSTTKAHLNVSIRAVPTGPGVFDFEGSRFLVRTLLETNEHRKAHKHFALYSFAPIPSASPRAPLKTEMMRTAIMSQHIQSHALILNLLKKHATGNFFKN